jgi:hypothetical protein
MVNQNENKDEIFSQYLNSEDENSEDEEIHEIEQEEEKIYSQIQENNENTKLIDYEYDYHEDLSIY